MKRILRPILVPLCQFLIFHLDRLERGARIQQERFATAGRNLDARRKREGRIRV